MLKSESMAHVQDGLMWRGVLQQRYAVGIDGNVSGGAGFSAKSTARAYFNRADATRTVCVVWESSYYAIELFNAGSSSTELGNIGTSQPIPRCVYRDELLFCFGDGKTPMLRYSGSSSAEKTVSGNLVNTQNEATLTTSVAWSTAPSAGSYLPVVHGKSVLSWCRVVSSESTTKSTVEDVTYIDAAPAYSLTGTLVNSSVSNGWFPCQSIYTDGTCTVTKRTWSGGETTYEATGYGTKWSSGFTTPNIGRTALLYKDGDLWRLRSISEITSETAMVLASEPVGVTTGGGGGAISVRSGTGSTTTTTTTTKAAAQVMSAPTWTDACVHKGSLWGTGVEYHPNRVYVAPPNWNPSLPPQAVAPHDLSAPLAKESNSDWILDYIDVPTSYDGDPVVAILSTFGPLLVLKRSGAYGIYGTYPTFEQSQVADGAGCVERRAAISVDGRQFWAGRQGVYEYRQGTVVSITKDKIDREWRGLMSGYVDGTSSVCLGVVAGHLVVSVSGLDSSATGRAKTGPDSSNPTSRTYLYDMGANEWVSRVSGTSPINLWSARVPDEVDSLLYIVGDNVADFAPAVTGVKVTDRDAQTRASADTSNASDSPELVAWTSSGLAQAAGVEGDSRLVDMSVVGRFKATGAAGADFDFSVVQTEGLTSPASGEVPAEVGTIQSSSNNGVVSRSRFRVGRSGRTHQVRFARDNGGSTDQAAELHQIVLNFRDGRART
jgi:hypothetical protein